MNATRFALPPLPQPTYSFRDIPRSSYPDLKGSTLEYVSNREDFQRCMAEMLLCCKEAVRRNRSKREQQEQKRKEQQQQTSTDAPNDNVTTPADTPRKRGRKRKTPKKDEEKPTSPNLSKPLSLEYLADRLDVDEPLWGYVVRHEGRIQGFVCVTTFTNYERSFRWDSLNEAAFSDDNAKERKERETGERKVDTQGLLSRKLQSTVRCGNVWEEGVVWPRIAEISLLGGLGCGRLLVELVLEDLERMNASSKANYDHVVLQATDNSVPFYETMGFVRVGAIVERDDKGQAVKSLSKASSSGALSSPLSPASQRRRDKKNFLALPDNIIMSQVKEYEVAKAGEPLSAIAKKFKVDVYDLIFLNEINYPDLQPSSRIIKGTLLRIPNEQSGSSGSTGGSRGAIKWHIAKENDTPRSIARMYQLDSDDVVKANRNRLKGLLVNSRLKQGTEVRVSHLDSPDIAFVPYAHWSFPDDDHFEEGEPSYMMAKTLQRKRGMAAKSRPIRGRLAITIQNYQQPNNELLSQVPTFSPPTTSQDTPPDVKPQDPDDVAISSSISTTGYSLFESNVRSSNPQLIEQFDAKEEENLSDALDAAWRDLSIAEKIELIKEAKSRRAERQKKIQSSIVKEQQKKIQSSIVKKTTTPEFKQRVSSNASRNPRVVSDSQENLYNMVVRIDPTLNPTVDVDTQEFKYWYVLTFIPDLRWCHLAPMIPDGVFGKDKPKAEGRTKWKLVDEKLGKELDISSSFCIPCKSKAMKRTLDADKEEWDVVKDTVTVVEKRKTYQSTTVKKKKQSLGVGDQCLPPLALCALPNPSFRKRNRSVSPSSEREMMDERELVATLWDTGTDVRVKLKGIDGGMEPDDASSESCSSHLEPLTKKAKTLKGEDSSSQRVTVMSENVGGTTKTLTPSTTTTTFEFHRSPLVRSSKSGSKLLASSSAIPTTTKETCLGAPLGVAIADATDPLLEEQLELNSLTQCCIFVD